MDYAVSGPKHFDRNLRGLDHVRQLSVMDFWMRVFAAVGVVEDSHRQSFP
jgi:hypothetical protein